MPGVCGRVAPASVVAACGDDGPDQAARDARGSTCARGPPPGLRSAKQGAVADRAGDMSRRVAIVGIGLVTSLGSTREDSWSRMLAGECGIRDVTLFDTEGYRSRLAAEVAMEDVDASLTA